VFLLSRFHPLLALSPWLLDALLVAGFGSIAVGGVLALCEVKLKRILAYSTVSQYGYVVVALGAGGAKGAAAACLYVVTHGIAKSALFMTAGTVSDATGQDRIDACGGLARAMPVTAAASAICAATVAGLPLTLGFFADELYYGAAAAHGTPAAVAAVAGAGLTLAYMARFWARTFLGRRRAEAAPVPVAMVAPVAVLAVALLLGGFQPSPFAALAEPAAADAHGAPAPVEAAYHLDARVENVMALSAIALGVLLVLGGRLRSRAAAALARLGRVAGPERLYGLGLRGLNRLSDAIHAFELRDLRGRVAAVLVPGWVLVVAGIAAAPRDTLVVPGAVRGEDLPLVVALAVVVGAALAVVRPRRHITLMLALSAVGFALALVYALMGAPDVALVAVLIETVFALLFLGAFALLPPEVLRREARLQIPRGRVRRDALVGLGSGLIAAVVVLSALSRETPEDSMAQQQIAATPSAHGKDVVTVILADFRALDTMVEITVVGVALLGIVLLLRREDPA
jgi:multicomponent Na+:H+ antiporter subunit A